MNNMSNSSGLTGPQVQIILEDFSQDLQNAFPWHFAAETPWLWMCCGRHYTTPLMVARMWRMGSAGCCGQILRSWCGLVWHGRTLGKCAMLCKWRGSKRGNTFELGMSGIASRPLAIPQFTCKFFRAPAVAAIHWYFWLWRFNEIVIRRPRNFRISS